LPADHAVAVIEEMGVVGRLAAAAGKYESGLSAASCATGALRIVCRIGRNISHVNHG